MPVGMAWTGLIAITVVQFHRRRVRGTVVSLAATILFTLLGNSDVAGSMIAWLERDYADVRPFALPPFDAVFVMGGGITHARDGTPYLTASGDRVVLGARLYHAGRTPLLVTSGESIPGTADAIDAAAATERVWRELDIPSHAILRIPDVYNSREEIAAYARLTAERGFRRVGLVTSGYHLRRAMRLAGRAGFAAVPLPADRRAVDRSWGGIRSVVPTGWAFAEMHTAAWELVGAATGR
jgi:uncharacterized SAM-binding protein YcdF (DUF218 family)